MLMSFLLVLISLAVVPLPPLVGAAATGAYVPDELLVKFKPGVSRAAQESLLRAHRVYVKAEIAPLQVKLLSVNPQALAAVQDALARNPLVEYVEKNMRLQPEVVPNDPYYSSEWHLNKIQAPQAWDISQGSASVVIAVLDSGIDTTHPDLASKLLSGWNFYDNNDNVADVYGHGTKVAGTAAAVTNDALGVAAIGWQPKILPIRVTDPAGYAYSSTLSQGLVYAADRGAKAAVMSFGIYGGSTFSDAAKYLYDRGGWAVAAGGNDGTYHADNDNPYILSVSASSTDDSLASFSSNGPYIDLAAPGVSIYTTVRGGGYGAVSGTSFSAPLTAGLVSLIFSLDPSLTPKQVLDILQQSAKDLGTAGYDIYYGWGRIDAYQALAKTAGISSTPDTTPPAASITSPTNGAQVSGTISIDAGASDNVAVTKVELYKDGTLYAVDTTAPYAFIWDTTADPNGSHGLVAKAYDASNNAGTSNTVTVSVDNVADTTPPDVSILSPAAGAKVMGVVTISVSAFDASGIQRVEFHIDGKLKATVYGSPYGYQWNSRSVKDGVHTILVKAFDRAGNMGQASITVTVANRA